ncbi:MAG: hypothetical protein H6819_02255 [Phycisphaerales bacterium]|nr:hypothetical protein [Phycisphaerales bacterium]MCB9856965.1 hypothetical protein [Phycisphaerales bacterium]MCB9861908.1 hypothetical protein [Phycisphaerales bacterium]
MDDKLRNFKELALDWLGDNRERLQFGEPLAGESDHLLAGAPVEGLGQGQRERVLVFAKRGNTLIVKCHHVLYLGSKGEHANRTAHHLLRKLFACNGNEIEKLEGDQFDLMGLLVEQYRAGRRETDELLAHVVFGSNVFTDWTKASVDWRDGEVMVALTQECNFESLPESLEDDVLAVLNHAQRLIRLAQVIRQLFTPEPRVPDAALNRLKRDLTELIERRTAEAEYDKPEDAESGALTL